MMGSFEPERTAGDPSWGVVRREEHVMSYRRAMSRPRRVATSRE